MTRARAIELLKGVQFCCDLDDCTNAWDCEECDDALNMAIEALENEPKWIPVSWHTEEERAENGYPKDWVVFMDCEMPSDGQEILVTTRYGTVEKDMCYEDGEFGLDSGYDWIDDILAWKPLPEPYEEADE